MVHYSASFIHIKLLSILRLTYKIQLWNKNSAHSKPTKIPELPIPSMFIISKEYSVKIELFQTLKNTKQNGSKKIQTELKLTKKFKFNWLFSFEI